MKRYQSRKFWAMMFWQAVLVWMRVQGHLPVEAFVSLTTVVLGGYFAANVASTWAQTRQPQTTNTINTTTPVEVTTYAN